MFVFFCRIGENERGREFGEEEESMLVFLSRRIVGSHLDWRPVPSQDARRWSRDVGQTLPGPRDSEHRRRSWVPMRILKRFGHNTYHCDSLCLTFIQRGVVTESLILLIFGFYCKRMEQRDIRV